jgi:hypothetical protein
MREWIPILVLYVVGLGLFRILGGFGAAGSAVRRWGHGSSALKSNPGSSS